MLKASRSPSKNALRWVLPIGQVSPQPINPSSVSIRTTSARWCICDRFPDNAYGPRQSSNSYSKMSTTVIFNLAHCLDVDWCVRDKDGHIVKITRHLELDVLALL